MRSSYRGVFDFLVALRLRWDETFRCGGPPIFRPPVVCSPLSPLYPPVPPRACLHGDASAGSSWGYGWPAPSRLSIAKGSSRVQGYLRGADADQGHDPRVGSGLGRRSWAVPNARGTKRPERKYREFAAEVLPQELKEAPAPNSVRLIKSPRAWGRWQAIQRQVERLCRITPQSHGVPATAWSDAADSARRQPPCVPIDRYAFRSHPGQWRWPLR